MHIDKKFLQRAFLAFTTGFFLACAAHVSSNDAPTATIVSPASHPAPAAPASR